MACSCPVAVWPAVPGSSSKRVVYSSAKSYAGARSFLIPCGHCMGCLAADRQAWALRMVHESRCHEHSWFATMTFSDEQLPSDMCLSVTVIQAFHKRLRHEIGPFRFYLAGEYAPGSKRPHYHAIYFGPEVPDAVPWDKSASGEVQYRSEAFERAWPFGFVRLGKVTSQSCAYVAGYTTKKLGRQGGAAAYEVVHPFTGEVCRLCPEFSLMSRGGSGTDSMRGLGWSWFAKWKGDVFPSDFLILNGKRCAVPPYYLAQVSEAEREVIRARRRENAAGLLAAFSGSREVSFREFRRIVKRAMRPRVLAGGEVVVWCELSRAEKRERVALLLRNVVMRRVGRNAARTGAEGTDRRLMTKHQSGEIRERRLLRDMGAAR